MKSTNRTYTYQREQAALTHVEPGACQARCGVWDADLIGSVRFYSCRLAMHASSCVHRQKLTNVA